MLSQLHSDAQRIIAAVSAQPVIEISEVAAGVMTFKYFVKTATGDRYVVRFYPHTRKRVVAYEPDLIRRCREGGMRVPEVVTTSATGPAGALEYMAYRMVPGESLELRLSFLNQQSLNRICRNLMKELLLLKEIEIEDFGELVSDKRAGSPSWLSFMTQTFTEGIRSARSQNLLPSALINDIDFVRSNLNKFYYIGRPTLCWGDISPQNIIVDGNEFVGLIDFEGVLSAEFDLSFGYLRARYAGTGFYSTFADHWPGGKDHATSARAALFVLVRALRLLSHGREPLPTGIPREPLNTFLPGLEDAIYETHKCILSPYEG